MKTLYTIVFACLAVCNFAQTIYTVGPGQQYNSITAAYNAIPSSFTGPYVITLHAGYSSLNETFPIDLGVKSASSATNTITIKPVVSGLIIASANSTGTLRLNGCKYVKVDGSVNGTGDTANLTILNSATAGTAVLIDPNGANNTLTCLTMLGATGAQQVVAITGQNPNDTISRCNIASVNNTWCQTGIYAYSTAATGLQVLNNNVYSVRDGMYILTQASGLNIQGNSIYSFIEHTNAYPIRVTVQGGTARIFGNFIGGSAPRCQGAITKACSSSSIEVFAPVGALSVVDSNVIRNIQIGDSINCSYYGFATNGSVAIGDVYGNIVGDTTSHGSIVINLTTTINSVHAARVKIFYAGYPGLVQNNTVGGIDFNVPAASAFTDLHLADGNNALAVFRNNFIGSSVMNDNIRLTGGGYYLHFNLVHRFNLAEGNTFSGITTTNFRTFFSAIDTVDAARNNKFSNFTINNVTGNPTQSHRFILADTITGNKVSNIQLYAMRSMTGFEGGRVTNNNIIDGVSNRATAPPTSTQFTGIKAGNLSASYIHFYIRGNSIGNISVPDSASGSIIGITNIKGPLNSYHIDSNRLYNFTAFNSCIGIDPEGDTIRCANNTLSGLSTRLTLVGINANSISVHKYIKANRLSNFKAREITGILTVGGVNGRMDSVNNNVLDNFCAVPSATSSQVLLTGIETKVTGCVFNNSVTHLWSEGSTATSLITGIYSNVGNVGTTYVYNNLVQVGVKANGAVSTADGIHYGLRYVQNTTGYYNTVYVARTMVGAAANTYAMHCSSPANTFSNYNNILINNAATTGGTGRNAAIYINSVINQQCDYNIYRAVGANGVVALIDTLPYTLAGFKTAMLGQNLASMDTGAALINPAGDTITLNLGPLANSPALAHGTTFQVPVATDYYNVVRSISLPAIGAIEKPGMQAPVVDSVAHVACSAAATGFIKYSIANNLAWDTVRVTNSNGQVVTTQLGVTGQQTVSQLPAGTYSLKFTNTTGGVYLLVVTIQSQFASPAPPVVSNQTICTGQSVTITASGAGNYQWYDAPVNGTLLSSTASLSTGVLNSTRYYYVQTTANGCASARAVDTVTTVQLAAPVITFAPTNICSGQTTTLTASGTSGAVSWYSVPANGNVLHTGASYTTPLTTTTILYAEQSTGNCTSPRGSVTIPVDTLPAAPVITGGMAPVCSGKPDTLTVTNNGNSYTWYTSSTGGNILGTGATYITAPLTSATTVFVGAYDGTCSSQRIAVQLLVLITLPPVVSPSPANICPGQTAALNATASAGTVTWYDNANLATPVSTGNTYTTPAMNTGGTYYAVVTGNNGCISQPASVQVVLHPQSAPVITVLNGNVLSATTSTGYQWYLNGSIINGAAGNLYTATVTGNYTVVTTNQYGCSETSTPVNVVISGVDEVDGEKAFGYPNPCTDVLMLQVNTTQPLSIHVFDISGRLLITETMDATPGQIAVNNLAPGLYYVKMAGKSYTGRFTFVKQ